MSGGEAAEAFVLEAADLLDQVERALLDLGRDLNDRAAIDEVFRGLHTIKGSGAMFGFAALAGFTHHCETAFDRVRKGKAPASVALVHAVLSACDHMRALVAHRDQPQTTEQSASGQALLAALDTAMAGSPDAAPAVVETAPTAPADDGTPTGWAIRFRLPPGAMANGTNPLALLQELRELGPCTVRLDRSELPPLDRFVPTECYLGWDVELAAAVSREQVEDVFLFILDTMELTLTPLGATAAAACPPSAEVSAPAAAPVAEEASAKPVVRTQESVRVQAERLDELMNRVGELVIAQSRLAQLAARGDHAEAVMLRAVSEDIDRLSSELRDTTMALRMMPMGNLFGRYRRLVFDLAQETGKAIALVTEGEATEVDKTVIDRLADPLVHLIRNSCDHGLETAAERVAAGKSATGQITVSAAQSGGEVIVTVADDGRGIDRAAVRAKAVAQGLIAEDAALDDGEVLQLIFHPGFSTAAQVTRLSGRGVGMDVVKKTVEGLRGTIRIESERGQGTRMKLHLPLTLAIVECMLVRVGAGRYAIPLSAVEECLQLPAHEAAGAGGRNFLDVRGELVPFLRMAEIFHSDRPAELHQKVVIVGSGQLRVGLVVDQIIGNAQTVIKPLSRFHAGVGAFSGATILGDGTVALILDVAQLLAAAPQPTRPPHDRALGEAA